MSLHPHEANAHLTAALFSPLVVTGPDTRLPAWGAAAPGAMLAEITSTDQRRVLEAVDGHPLGDRLALGRIRVEVNERPGATVDVAVGADGVALLEATGGGRREVQHLPGRQLAYLGLPLTDPRYAQAEVRRALSLAVDRESLARLVGASTEAVGGTDTAGGAGAAEPADRLLGPGSARAPDVVCEACRHDSAEAAALWPDDLAGLLTICFAADADHEAVVDAIAEGWTQALGVANLQLARRSRAPPLTARGAWTGPACAAIGSRPVLADHC